jgi:hypothetical protein
MVRSGQKKWNISRKGAKAQRADEGIEVGDEESKMKDGQSHH